MNNYETFKSAAITTRKTGDKLNEYLQMSDERTLTHEEERRMILEMKLAFDNVSYAMRALAKAHEPKKPFWKRIFKK
jgi:hypothetical protein